MSLAAPAFAYALFVWWFSTGAVLLLVLRPEARRTTLALAALAYVAGLVSLRATAGSATVPGSYGAFTGAIVLWGVLEYAFLTGEITGPRPLPCPQGAAGWRRFSYAVRAILWHELSLAVTGLVVVAGTWDAPNQVGTLTFVVLWVMRLSAKLNLYLGVPVLNDDVMPRPIAHLRSYFARTAAANAFFPVAMVASVCAACLLVGWAFEEGGRPATEVGYTLVASLLVLAILEHIFMLVPLPIDRLWAWSRRDFVPKAEADEVHP